MNVYADTSFLCSLYVKDVHSKRAYSYMQHHQEPLAVTPFQHHELSNTIKCAVFWKYIDGQDMKTLLSLIESHLKSGILQSVAIPWNDVFKAASDLGDRYTPLLGIRSSDLLHVATA